MGNCMPRRAAWFLVLFVVSTGCSKREENAQSTVSAQEKSQRTVSGDRANGVKGEGLSALVDMIVAEAAELPQAEFDPAARAKQLGKDPQAHFEWVRDRTSWAAYRGLLRGSQGVMLDRVGSSLDRSILLGDLLRRSGHKVRLAHAVLTDAKARELLGKIRPIPEEQLRAMPNELLTNEESVTSRVAEGKRRMGEANGLVRSQTDYIFKALGETLKNPRSDDRSDADFLRKHSWVEYYDRGNWVALDVLLPGSRVGESIATATSYSDWAAESATPAVVMEEWHTIGIRIIVERYQDGATSESTVLETTLYPASLIGLPVTLGHVPRPLPSALIDAETASQVRKDAASGVREWLPYLIVGDDLIAQSAFTLAGEISTNPLAPLRDIGRTGGGGLLGGMDMALGAGSGEDLSTHATAEWIEYEIHVPGESAEEVRRTVFDLLGPERRANKSTGFDGNAEMRKLERAGALWSQTDILLQPCNYPREFVSHLQLSGVVASQAELLRLAMERDPAQRKAQASGILQRMRTLGPLYDLALWRSTLGTRDGSWYVDRVNVLNYRVALPMMRADQLAYEELIDIAANPVGVRERGAEEEFETRVEQGVADTVAEMLALGSELSEAENTASVFATLAAEGSRGLMIAAHDRGAVNALPWPADEMLRVAADVEAGYVVIVPRKAVVRNGQQRVGWWRVDPVSGETIGVMDSGFHAAEEKSELESTIASLRNYLKKDADDWEILRRGVARINRGRTSQWYPKELRQRDALEEMLRILEAAAG